MSFGTTSRASTAEGYEEVRLCASSVPNDAKTNGRLLERSCDKMEKRWKSLRQKYITINAPMHNSYKFCISLSKRFRIIYIYIHWNPSNHVFYQWQCYIIVCKAKENIYLFIINWLYFIWWVLYSITHSLIINLAPHNISFINNKLKG